MNPGSSTVKFTNWLFCAFLLYSLFMPGLKLSVIYCVTTGYLLLATAVATQKGHQLLK